MKFENKGISLTGIKEISHIENMINNIQTKSNTKIYFQDENGNVFFPSGNIHIGVMSCILSKTKEDEDYEQEN